MPEQFLVAQSFQRLKGYWGERISFRERFSFVTSDVAQKMVLRCFSHLQCELHWP